MEVVDSYRNPWSFLNFKIIDSTLKNYTRNDLEDGGDSFCSLNRFGYFSIHKCPGFQSHARCFTRWPCAAVASNVFVLRNHALTAALTSFTASSNGIASMPCRMGNGCFPLCTKIRRSDPMSFAALWNPRSVVGALDSLISIAQHLPGANSRTRSISAPALSCPPDVGQSALHCQTVSNGFVRCYELLVAASLYSGNYASIFQG